MITFRTFTRSSFAVALKAFPSFPCQEASSYAEENNLLFMETSAKTSLNVNEIFHQIGLCILSPLCCSRSLVLRSLTKLRPLLMIS